MTTPFGRTVILQLGPPGGAGRSIQGLRIAARVKHSRKRSSSSATIEVYNPAPETVALLEPRDAVVRLLAGYDLPREIWLGKPVPGGVQLERKGPTRTLTIESKDTSRRFATTTLAISFDGDVALADILEEVATQTQIPRRQIDVSSQEVLVGGVHYEGPVEPFLDQLAADLGSEWSLVDGQLQLLEDGADSGRLAPLISSQKRNLVGTPTRKSKRLIEVTALLTEPGLRPGDPFVVQSESINGDFVAREVTFNVDSWDGPFTMTLLGRPR